VAGDDDQAIFVFKGADPDWLGRLASQTDPVILGQSYRVPGRVHALANAIIKQNSRRVAKVYKPTAERGDVLQLDREEALDIIDRSAPTLVLTRNRQYLGFYAKGLMKRGVPYLVEGAGGPNPLAIPFIREAVETALRIQRGEKVSLADLGTFLKFVSPDADFIPGDLRAHLKEKRRKKTIFELIDPARSADLDSIKRAIAKAGPIGVLGKFTDERRAYFEVIIRQYGQIPEPQIRLTSIHGAKGREADFVVVDSSMSKATFKAYRGSTDEAREAENRVFYVAVTRARRQLVLVRSHTRRHFEFPRVDAVGGHRG
jgi:DNA helicase-2/ATP-dependent DNA helicase PcrA